MRFHLLLQLCISLSVCTLFSQNPPTLEYDYQVVDLNSRYNITSITDMCFDSAGYLYIATKEGLMIWDNNRTRLINHNSNDDSDENNATNTQGISGAVDYTSILYTEFYPVRPRTAGVAVRYDF